MFELAKSGDAAALCAALDRDPAALYARDQPYEWTLLHHAAQQGHLAVVDLLLRRGFDVNTKEKGDNTAAINWAAAAGHVDVVRRLLDAGVDPIGHGDDHELEVIGWATCWEGGDDDAHRAIVELLIARGARHHIFSAIATGNEAEVRRIVADDPMQLERRMSRNEDFQRPLHFAVRMNRAVMVGLLVELGANPLAKDGSGFPPSAYARRPDVDRVIHESLAARGDVDLFTALVLGDYAAAERLGRDPAAMASAGLLQLMSKRGDVASLRWLLHHGADPNARWAHWDAAVTPLHMAVMENHEDCVRALLDARADPSIRDSKFDSDAIGWAEFFQRPVLVRLLKSA
jgi:ankyrin repeat protein